MGKNILSLNGIWKLKAFKPGELLKDNISSIEIDSSWININVPGDVYYALFESGMIPDPMYGDNYIKCKWVAEYDWLYYKSFKVPSNFKQNKTFLVFRGIDTYSMVWFNGKKIGSTDNMFREYEFNIADLLRVKQENHIIVLIKSTIKNIEKFSNKKYISLFNKKRIFVRKAQCHFGWDWAPDLPAIGIWRDCEILSRREHQIDNVFIKTKIDGIVTFFIETDHPPERTELNGLSVNYDINERKYKLVIKIYDDRKNLVKKEEIEVRGGKNYLTLKLNNPKLWWPNGYGESYLYNYTVELIRNGNEFDCYSGKFGIREIELKQDPKKNGEFNFQFLINGIPVFCKGANWIPPELFMGTIRKEKYLRLIKLAKEANFNILRIWGGGVYENDEFYELCDENGIMIWQDFMFSCSDLPGDQPWFLEMIIPEIEFQLKRLRNHPSIIYWCGGNELAIYAGYKVSFSYRIFHYIIRGLCNDLDSSRPYGVSSPISFSDLGNDQNSGDAHVSSFEQSYQKGINLFRTELNKCKAKFISEFYALGPVRFQSLKKYMPEDKLWPTNDLYELRNKYNPHSLYVKDTYTKMQLEVAAKLFGEFNNLRDFLKKAMTAQSELLSAEIEYHRSRKYNCSGLIFWMYNDTWPTSSWSVVDYYLLPKPSYFAVKRAYKPLLITIQKVFSNIEAYIINDLIYPVEGNIEIGQRDLDGNIIWHEEIHNFKVLANYAVKVSSFKNKYKNIPNSYLFARYINDYENVDSVFFYDLWKNKEWPDPQIYQEIIFESKEGDYYKKIIAITSKNYARMVNINLSDESTTFYSDNFFDIEAGKTKKIVIRSKKDFNINNIRVDHWLTEWL